jgi:hypothetical protein
MITRRSFVTSIGSAAAAVGILAHKASASSPEKQPSLKSPALGPAPKFPRSILPKSPSSARREIQEFVDRILIMDTHEHFLTEAELIRDAQKRNDFMQLFIHYFPQDIIAAGMPEEEWNNVFESQMPTDVKWKIIEPYLSKAQNTAYYWVLDLAIRNYYGIDGLSASTYRELSDKIREEYRPGIYDRIVCEAAGIEKAITDHCDRQKAEDYANQTLICPTWKVDPWIYIRGKGDLETISKESNMDVTGVSGIRRALGAILEMRRKSGIIAVKCGLAYDRSLEFKFVSEQDAQRALDTLLKEDDPAAARVLQDYVFHVVVQACTDNHLPIQIHTGLLGRSNYGHLARTNPMLLAEVFAHYTKTKFDVFHAGYPWMREVGTLGRINTSVYADLCWAQFICPAAAQSALDEWLDSMPASKILAFGGDYWFPEGSYGHSIIARTNIGEVLANRVERGRMTMDQARTVARMILRDNVIELYGL